jgi:hypothetical protein
MPAAISHHGAPFLRRDAARTGTLCEFLKNCVTKRGRSRIIERCSGPIESRAGTVPELRSASIRRQRIRRR